MHSFWLFWRPHWESWRSTFPRRSVGLCPDPYVSHMESSRRYSSSSSTEPLVFSEEKSQKLDTKRKPVVSSTPPGVSRAFDSLLDALERQIGFKSRAGKLDQFGAFKDHLSHLGDSEARALARTKLWIDFLQVYTRPLLATVLNFIFILFLFLFLIFLSFFWFLIFIFLIFSFIFVYKDIIIFYFQILIPLFLFFLNGIFRNTTIASDLFKKNLSTSAYIMKGNFWHYIVSLVEYATHSFFYRKLWRCFISTSSNFNFWMIPIKDFLRAIAFLGSLDFARVF